MQEKKTYSPPTIEIIEIDKEFCLMMTSEEPPDDPEGLIDDEEEA
jgi:hypothetical protein